MRNIHIARDARPRALDAEKPIVDHFGPRFTPGEFFKDAGTVIAVCLVLGVIMQVLLG